MEHAMPPLSIIAQPKAVHRERYMCETDRRLNRAQRFVRAEENEYQYVHPTIRIPEEWIVRCQHTLYIRLTLVTVPSDHAPVRCVHPYPIDTEEMDVIKDSSSNSLYFPISKEELILKRKTFLFTQKKLTKYQLKAHGPLRILNSDERDESRLLDCSDVRNLIQTYELRKSQLLFSLAYFQNKIHLPVIYDISSVYSQIMTALTTITIDDSVPIQCSPRKGNWRGGEEVLMVIPKLDKRRQFSVRFLYSATDSGIPVHPEFMDTKTILFITPPCPITLTQENPTFCAQIVVTQNGTDIGQVNFLYQSSHRCVTCSSSLTLTNTTTSHAINKRSYAQNSETYSEKFNETPSKVKKIKCKHPSFQQGSYLATKQSPSHEINSQYLSSDELMQNNKLNETLKTHRQNSDLATQNYYQNVSKTVIDITDQKNLIEVIRKGKSKQVDKVVSERNPLYPVWMSVPDVNPQDKMNNLATILYTEVMENKPYRTLQHDVLCIHN